MSLEATKEFNIDTVENAAATPKVELPWAELGLKDNEFAEIVKILGRRPTAAELAMYSVMWSEHCSYKSTKNHLRQFGQKVTPEMKKDLMVGMGENAGVTNLGDGWAVTFKIESHNSPSFVEPHQGAATGIGGIVRDIISMGARPIAVMDPLRFGAIDHPDSQRVVHGVVSGIGSYGNSLGLPNIGGETVFDPIYQGNPLVNALAVGALRHEDLRLATPPAWATRSCSSVHAPVAMALVAPRCWLRNHLMTPSHPSAQRYRLATRLPRRYSSSAAWNCSRLRWLKVSRIWAPQASPAPPVNWQPTATAA